MPETRIHILLVEDNDGDARLVEEMLSENRRSIFDVVHVHYLSEALNELNKGGVDVALLDLSLPDSQGSATVTSVYVAAPGVPIVVMSGTDDESVTAKAVEEGAQDYLVKGHVDSEILAHSIRFAIERQRILNEKLTATTDFRWLLVRRWLAGLDAKVAAIAKAIGVSTE
jgi:DNA-binding response OmpR family regulator